MQGLRQLMARLLYGCGLRLMGCVRLRVKDIDFEQSQVVVREGKGEKDRLTMLPVSLIHGAPGRPAQALRATEADANFHDYLTVLYRGINTMCLHR